MHGATCGPILVALLLLVSCHSVRTIDPCAVAQCPDGTACQLSSGQPDCIPLHDADIELDGDTDTAPDRDADIDEDGEELCPPTGLPYAGDCDPVTQRCCPEGYRCTVDVDPRRGFIREFCLYIQADGQSGDPCYERRELACGAGFTCVGGGYIATCGRFCESEEDCPDDHAYRCRPLDQGAEEYSICYPDEVDCNPANQDVCPPGEVCVIASWNWLAGETYTTCITEGENEAGEWCGNERGCRSPAGCYVNVTTREELCMEMCVLPDGECPPLSSCSYIDHDVYGVCVPW